MFSRSVALILLVSSAVAKDKPPKVYPETGTVVAMRMESTVRGRVYTDPQGKTYGRVRSYEQPVYKIRTKDFDYEVEGNSLTIGDAVNFRLEKDKVFVKHDEKEQKFSLVGAEQRTTQ
jgi:hypothetical protein